jgi:RimJ/RimL family protein N-acetyltransferase
MRNPITLRRHGPIVAHPHARLPDSAQALVRPIRENDAEEYARASTRLSAETRRRRFLNATPRLSARELSYLTAVDQDEHVALVAVEPGSGEILGSVRYVRIGGGRADAELAIEVIDGWQRRGLGRALLSAVGGHALANGLTRFYALVAADNLPMQQALKRAVVAVDSELRELEYLLDVDALVPARTGRRLPAIWSWLASAAAALHHRLRPAATPA